MCDHAWKNAFGADLDGSMNLAPVNAANGAGSVFGSSAVDSGDITTGNITLGSGNTGNTTFGDVTVDASRDLNFFFTDQPVIADGSGSLFSGLFGGLFSGIFGGSPANPLINAANGAGSVFGSSAVDSGDITTGNITLGSGNTGNTTFGDVTVDASRDLNFFFGSSLLFTAEVA